MDEEALLRAEIAEIGLKPEFHEQYMELRRAGIEGNEDVTIQEARDFGLDFVKTIMYIYQRRVPIGERFSERHLEAEIDSDNSENESDE